MFTFVMTKGEQTRQRIVATALALFEERGYTETTLRDIAEVAGISIGLAYRYFRRKEELVLALYEQLSIEVADKAKLPEGSVGERWAALERTRFQVLAPHRKTLLALVQATLDPDGELGALSPATAAVRDRWRALHQSVVAGANGAPPAALAQLLYGLDLMLVVFWTQDRTAHARATRKAIDRLAKLVDLAVAFPGTAGVIAELADTFDTLTRKSPSRKDHP
jgi:AcrR family transcriptional regulator